jgi:hypothetical protein
LGLPVSTPLYSRGRAVTPPRSKSADRAATGPAAPTERPAAEPAGTRDQLSREVKLLGALLGQVIAEQGGPALLDLVERCRLRSIAFRENGDEVAESALAAELDTLDVERAEALAKAFSLYFGLVNLAEERDAVRRLRRGQRDGHARRGDAGCGRRLAPGARLVGRSSGGAAQPDADFAGPDRAPH